MPSELVASRLNTTDSVENRVSSRMMRTALKVAKRVVADPEKPVGSCACGVKAYDFIKGHRGHSRCSQVAELGGAGGPGIPDRQTDQHQPVS
jgi:hypothetical protein